MKNLIQKAAVLLTTAALLTSSLAVSASAGVVKTAPSSEAMTNNVIRSNDALFQSGGAGFCYEEGYYYDGSYYYYASGSDIADYQYVNGSKSGIERSVMTENIIRSAPKTTPGVISGGLYYTDADALLQAYFALNTYATTMMVGEVRSYGDHILLYSSNPSVVLAGAGSLTAVSAGSADVYVYTEGGVPFLRISVTVSKTGTVGPQIFVYPDSWMLDCAGSFTGFVVKAPVRYNDILFSIVHGSAYASIVNGRLVAKGYGPVVVRAYSRSNPAICGETIVYVGKYCEPVYDGYWYTSGKDICVNTCPYSVWSQKNCYVNGWIQSPEGLLIPVVKAAPGTAVNPDGTTRDTVVLYGDTVSLNDLLRGCYGDKASLADILRYYYLIKNYGWCPTDDVVTVPSVPSIPSLPSLPTTPHQPTPPHIGGDHHTGGHHHPFK